MIPDGLLQIVKNDNDITWTDEAMERKLERVIGNGVSKLDRLNGRENDYINEGQAQSLLLNYVKYDLSNCLDDFDKNYQSEIIAFINQAKVDAYVASKAGESE